MIKILLSKWLYSLIFVLADIISIVILNLGKKEKQGLLHLFQSKAIPWITIEDIVTLDTGSVNFSSFLKLLSQIGFQLEFILVWYAVEFSFPLILENLFVHYVLISSEVFLTEFSSKEVDKHNGNLVGVIAYSFQRLPVMDIEIAQ